MCVKHFSLIITRFPKLCAVRVRAVSYDVYTNTLCPDTDNKFVKRDIYENQTFIHSILWDTYSKKSFDLFLDTVCIMFIFSSIRLYIHAVKIRGSFTTITARYSKHVC